jgi:hypothetical protein
MYSLLCKAATAMQLSSVIKEVLRYLYESTFGTCGADFFLLQYRNQIKVGKCQNDISSKGQLISKCLFGVIIWTK